MLLRKRFKSNDYHCEVRSNPVVMLFRLACDGIASYLSMTRILYFHL